VHSYISRRLVRSCLLAAGIAALISAAPETARAQGLSAERDAVFAQMFRDPANEALMLEYARLSIELRDFEAAVATLERLVDANPTAQEARYELAVAYFALGSHEVAQYHMDIYTSGATLTPAEAENAARYQEAIDERSASTSLGGYVHVGAAYLSEEGETGLSFGAGLNHEYDLGGAHETYWQTLFRMNALRFEDSPGNDQTGAYLRTGPVFRLTGSTFGPEINPFIEAQVIEDDGTDDQTTISAGIGYENTLTAFWAIFGELEGGWFERDEIDVSGHLVQAQIGVTYRPSRETRLRFSLRGNGEYVDGAGTDQHRVGARLDLSHRFAPGLDALPRDWMARAHLSADIEEFDTGREDDLASAGASLRAFVTDAAYVELGASYFQRLSSDPVFDDDTTLFSLKIGTEF